MAQEVFRAQWKRLHDGKALRSRKEAAAGRQAGCLGIGMRNYITALAYGLSDYIFGVQTSWVRGEDSPESIHGAMASRSTSRATSWWNVETFTRYSFTDGGRSGLPDITQPVIDMHFEPSILELNGFL